MSSIRPSGNKDLGAAITKSMHEHWRLYLAEGIVLVILGLAAIVIPPLAGIATAIFLGWLFVLAGIAGLVSTLRAKQAPGFGWSLLSALVALIAGVILLWNPLQGVITLTYVLIAYLIVDGLLMIALAISHRRELSGRWEWLVVNGIIDLLLAAIIISGLPGAFTWALGLIVGIDLAFGGATLIVMALDARHTATA